MSDQIMRINSMKLENKELRQQMADNTTLWHDLQHDLVTLNGIPEGKGRRQQVGRRQRSCLLEPCQGQLDVSGLIVLANPKIVYAAACNMASNTAAVCPTPDTFSIKLQHDADVTDTLEHV